MKLAEALQERADLNKKIEELKARIENCVLVQEGEEPGEDPAALLKELDDAFARLETLMAAINLTNSRTKVNGKSLTQIIAHKDAMNFRRGAYRSIYYAAAQTTQRARGTEIKVKALLKSADIQRTMDQLAKEARELDNLLQETNWKTKLIEL